MDWFSLSSGCLKIDKYQTKWKNKFLLIWRDILTLGKQKKLIFFSHLEVIKTVNLQLFYPKDFQKAKQIKLHVMKCH